MGLRISGASADKFNILQKKAEQQATAQTQEQKDALKRRFAALGAQGSGEAIKLEQQAGEQGAQRLQSAREGIEFAKLDEQSRLDAEQRGRDFATSERLGSQAFGAGETALGRKFASEQAGLQRGFLTGERLGSQEFQSGQADTQRSFLTGERIGAQDFATTERLGAQGFATTEREGTQTFQSAENVLNRQLTANESLLQRNFEGLMFDQQFAEDVRVTNENLKIAQKEANKKNPGLIGGLFGDVNLSLPGGGGGGSGNPFSGFGGGSSLGSMAGQATVGGGLFS